MNNDFSTGSVTSIEDMVRKVLASVIGQILPGGGGMANMAMPFIRSLTGNDVAWDMPLHSNMTGEGIYQHQLRTQARNMERLVAESAQREVTKSMIRDIERTKTAYEDWQMTNPGLGRGDYDAYIERNTEQAMRNKLYSGVVSMANRTFDLNGAADVGEGIGHVAANFAKQARLKNDPNALLFGRYMAEKMFEEAVPALGDDKEINPLYETYADGTKGHMVTRKVEYDRANWGGFNQKAITDLAGVLSQDMDLISAVDPSKGSELSTAAHRFRTMMHEYAEALEPLRDVFGNDMASIVNSMQRMTGQSMAAIGPVRAGIMAEEITARLNAGMYDRQYLNGNMASMVGRLEAMEGLSSAQYQMGPTAGIFLSDIARGAGVAPSYMSNRQWQQMAEEKALGVASAQATQAFAEHYSIWAKRQEQANGDTSWSAFFDQVAQYVDNGMDYRAAAARVSGAATAAARREGRSYGYYNTAMTDSSMAMAMDHDAILAESARRARIAASSDLAMRNTVARAMGGDTSDGVYNDTVKLAMDMLQRQPDLHNESPEVIETKIQTLYGRIHAGEMVPAMDASGKPILNDDGTPKMVPYDAVLSDQQMSAVASVINLMKSYEDDSFLKQYVVDVGQHAGAVRSLGRRNESRESRDRRMAAEHAMFSSGGGLMQLFKGGFGLDSIRKRLAAGAEVMAGDLQETSYMLAAAGQLAVDKYGVDDPASEAAAQAYAHTMYKYMQSVEAQSTGFQEAFARYKTAAAGGDAAGQKNALRLMEAYRMFGAEQVDAFMSGKVYDEKGAIANIKSTIQRTEMRMGPNGPALVPVNETVKRELSEHEKLILLSTMTPEQLARNKVYNEVMNLEKSEAGDKAKHMLAKLDKKAKGGDLGKAWEELREDILKDSSGEGLFNLAESKAGQATTQSAVRLLDRIMGVSKQGMTPAQDRSDNLELITVLKKLDDTLTRIATDNSGQVYGAKNTSNRSRSED